MDWLRKLKIGFVPVGNNLGEHPADRRRFLYYAKKRNINFEIASVDGQYDVVILTQAADYSHWIRRANSKSRYIFDFVDSYLNVDPYKIKNLARGTGKYLSRQQKYFRPNFWKTMEDMCACSEAVVCVTDEQVNSIRPFCKDVYKILDVMDEAVTNIKTDYSVGPVFNLVWEGLPWNLAHFYEIKEILSHIDQNNPIALHFITDVQYFQYLNSYHKKNSMDLINKIFHRSYLYQWNVTTFPKIALACDAAIIPLDLDNPLTKGKPENKLILLWKLGLPVITSASPAYDRAMKKAGLNQACHNPKDWVDQIEKLINDNQYRETTGIRAREFAEKEYHTNKVIEQWDKIFINHFS